MNPEQLFLHIFCLLSLVFLLKAANLRSIKTFQTNRVHLPLFPLTIMICNSSINFNEVFCQCTWMLVLQKSPTMCLICRVEFLRYRAVNIWSSGRLPSNAKGRNLLGTPDKSGICICNVQCQFLNNSKLPLVFD